jgi:hypothetical protein
MSNLKLSKQGNQLIKLYERMVVEGYHRQDGSKVEDTYNDFELKKFRAICKEHISHPSIKTVLDYGGGGSEWDAPDFEPNNGSSAKQFFDVEKVVTFEPARNQMEKIQSDCVVCMDVLEHIFITDIANVIDELFSLTEKLLVINVACYKAAALLPNGENAHITVRSPDWWKGTIDAAAIKYPDIKVLLICSQTFKTGVVFQPFKSRDWHSSNKYSIECRWATFQ